MTGRRVFVIWTNPLFHEAIRLILEHPHLQFVGSSSDDTTARGEILKLRPNIIIIEGAGECEPNQSIKVLESCSWDVLVVRISLNDNRLSLYHLEQRTVEKIDELLQLVLK